MELLISSVMRLLCLKWSLLPNKGLIFTDHAKVTATRKPVNSLPKVATPFAC